MNFDDVRLFGRIILKFIYIYCEQGIYIYYILAQKQQGCSLDQGKQILFYEIWKFKKNIRVCSRKIKIFGRVFKSRSTKDVRLGPRNRSVVAFGPVTRYHPEYGSQIKNGTFLLCTAMK